MESKYNPFSLRNTDTGRYRIPFSEKEVKDGQVQARFKRIVDSLVSLTYLDDENYKLPEIYRRFLPSVVLADEPSSVTTLYDPQSNTVNLASQNKGDLDLVKGAAYFLHTLFAHKKFTEFLDNVNDPDKRLQAEFLYGIIRESYAFWCLRCMSNPLVNNPELSHYEITQLLEDLAPEGLIKVGAFLGDLLFQSGLYRDVRRIYFETPSVLDQFDELVKIAGRARGLPRK